jgi:hypothetical protein
MILLLIPFEYQIKLNLSQSYQILSCINQISGFWMKRHVCVFF